MVNSEPHPLDPDSKLNPEERVMWEVLAGGFTPIDIWLVAARASSYVTEMHSLGAHVCVGRDCPHDTHRDPLPDAAHARHGDPLPSHVAADSIQNMAERHRAVLQIAQTFSDVFTYDELVHRYNARRGDVYTAPRGVFVEDLPAMEPQSIRSRCAELRRAGWIEQAGRALSDAGRPCNTWRVTR